MRILRSTAIWGLLLGVAPPLYAIPVGLFVDPEHRDPVAEISNECIAIAVGGVSGLVIGMLIDARRKPRGDEQSSAGF
jgi:hypothetical protein